jgi:hypothetical protein
MPTMTENQTAVANLALSHIGMREIDDIDDDETPSGEALRLFWEPSLKDVTSEHRWPFATVQASLNDSSTEMLEWTYTYDYPADAETVWSVFNSSTVKTKEEQEFEVIYSLDDDQKLIGSDLSDAYAEYSYVVEDPAKWSAKFKMAFSYRLAAAICVKLTGDDQKALRLMEIHSGIVSEAQRLVATERMKKPSQTSAYKTSRG